MSVTLADVAALAGVSQPTASRVLNGSTRKPAPHVVEAVRKAAEELGYIANAQAQALVRATSGLLGLVVQDIADPYFSAIAAGVEEVAERHARQVMLAVTHRDPERELKAVQTFIAHRADAVVMAGTQWSDARATRLRKRLILDLERYVGPGAKAAVVGKPLPCAHAVVPQNRRGAADLAHALVQMGTRDFVILGGPPAMVTAKDRTAGFVNALAEHAITPRAVVASDLTRDGGHEAARQALASLELSDGTPPCLFAVADVMALGAIGALREAGVRVPTDVQVAGFDDIATLRDHVPSLTTVRLPLLDMGRLAAELALDPAATRFMTRRMAGEVVLRDSTVTR
jgi:LacI family transcriptional regulator, galactose operon repressor